MRTGGNTVIVSSRLPLTFEPENSTPHYLRPRSDGLVRTLDSIMWDSGGIWVGCSSTKDIVALAEAGKIGASVTAILLLLSVLAG